MRSRSISPIRATLKTPWDDASERTKRRHVRKAGQAFSAVVSEVAPNDPDRLWNAIASSKAKQRLFPTDEEDDIDHTDDALLEAMVTCYLNANEWHTQRQILSYIADKVSYAKLCRWIPDLTRYRYTAARQHILQHGRGMPVPHNQIRTKIPLEKLSHFLDFITSPHIIQDIPFGSKTITLSNKEVIQVPNVVRNMIPERIVQQYQAYSKESQFTSLSRSTFLGYWKFALHQQENRFKASIT